MGKATRIYSSRESAIDRLNKLIDVLRLELYESQPSPENDKIIDIINQIEGIINMLKTSAIEKVTFIQIYVDVAKTRNTTMHIPLPHPEITWEKFASLSKE